MRVSALRIVHEPPPPPPWDWEGFEDVRETAQRHGSLFHDTGVSGRRDYFEPYRLGTEAWLDQQNAKNKARALAEYEWRKPENASARIATAKAEWLAQKAAREEYDRVLREQVAEAEAERERQKVIALAARMAERKRQAALSREARAAETERLLAEQAAAIAWWTSINPTYHGERYHPCRFTETMHFGAVTLEAGQGYWLPRSVLVRLRETLGYRYA